MKILQSIKPTAEQLIVIQHNKPGPTIIKGAAGSGKTTTALIRMKFLATVWRNRRQRLNINRPVNMLVITYNTTLRGYIQQLANEQIKPNDSTLNLKVKTFAKWAYDLLNINVNDKKTKNKLDLLVNNLLAKSKKQYSRQFIIDEASYAMERFLPTDIALYLSCERTGRGKSPRCNKKLREQIINQVILPYTQWKTKNRLNDFNDMAIQLAQSNNPTQKYDVVIVDEAQDLSANQVRAIQNHLATDHTVTYVLDSAQRIYPKGFMWHEIGLTIPKNQIFRLKTNYRNTKQIAAFIRPILDGVEIGGDDGTIPDFNNCQDSGPKPSVIIGRYSQQLNWVMQYIHTNVNLATESIAFLKPRGGQWFNELSKRLRLEGLSFVKLTRQDDWPTGKESIAISTMHSAKGLEFDHVIILGLNNQTTPHGTEPGDTQLDTLRRLLAMAIGRARKNIIIGYKKNEASSLIAYFKPDTFEVYKL